MMDSGEQRFFRLPFGSAPASSRARATDQCCPTRATKRGVCAFTSRMSIWAPAWISSSAQFLWPAEKWLVRIFLIRSFGIASSWAKHSIYTDGCGGQGATKCWTIGQVWFLDTKTFWRTHGHMGKHSPHPASCFPAQLLVRYLQFCNQGPRLELKETNYSHEREKCCLFAFSLLIKVPIGPVYTYFPTKCIHNALNTRWRSWMQQKTGKTWILSFCSPILCPYFC